MRKSINFNIISYKWLMLFSIFILLFSLSCDYSGEKRKHTLKIYNWADYIDEDLLEEFPEW
jgi:spermidine/putrescine transport system substrate-binding protein